MKDPAKAARSKRFGPRLAAAGASPRPAPAAVRGSWHADNPFRRHRLRHAAVRARLRTCGDARADELRQPRARRLRDGRRLRHRRADAALRRALSRDASRRRSSFRRCRARARATLYVRCTRRSHLDQVLFTIGLVFMAVAAVDYLMGSQQQIIQLPAWLQRPLRSSSASASAATGFFIIVVCGVLAIALQLGLCAHALRQPAARGGRRLHAWRAASAFRSTGSSR